MIKVANPPRFSVFQRLCLWFARFFIFLSLAPMIKMVYAQPSLESIELAKNIPIADVHMHTYEISKHSGSWWRDTMDAAGVRWGGGAGDYREDIQETLGERYIPSIGFTDFMRVFFRGGVRELENSEHEIFKRLYERSDRLFRDGKIKGFGEFHIDNTNSGDPKIRRKIRADNPALRKIYEIANRYGGVVQLHAEYTADFEKDVLALSSEFPKAITLLSHCLNTTNSKVLDNFFTKTNNIVCELSTQGAIFFQLMGTGRSPRAFDANGLKGEWRDTIERFPDRFMLGTDLCCGLDMYASARSNYIALVTEFRTAVLPYLTRETMEKVAHKNAVRVFKLQ